MLMCQTYYNEIERRFNESKMIKHIIVITRQEELIDFSR